MSSSLARAAAAASRRSSSSRAWLKRDLEGVHAVAAQEQRALGHAVQELAVVAHDQHRHLEVLGEPAFQRVDVGEIEVVGRLVEDQDVGLLQPRRGRDQQQPLPAAGEGAERPVEHLLRRRRSRPAARRCASRRRPAPTLTRERCSTSRTGSVGEALRHVLRHAADAAARASGSPGRRLAPARRSGISAGSTCRRRSRRPAPSGRRPAGMRCRRRRGPSRRRRRPAPSRARPDATPLPVPQSQGSSTPSRARMRPALTTNLRLGRVATASGTDPASTTMKSAGPPASTP